MTACCSTRAFYTPTGTLQENYFLPGYLLAALRHTQRSHMMRYRSAGCSSFKIASCVTMLAASGRQSTNTSNEHLNGSLPLLHWISAVKGWARNAPTTLYQACRDPGSSTWQGHLYSIVQALRQFYQNKCSSTGSSALPTLYLAQPRHCLAKLHRFD